MTKIFFKKKLKYIKNSKFFKLLFVLLPDKKFFVNTFNLFLAFLIFLIFFLIFYSTGSTQLANAESPFGDKIDSTMDGAFSYLTGSFGGQMFNCYYANTPIGKTSGNDIDCETGNINPSNIQAIIQGTYAGPLLWKADAGAIGRLVNATRAVSTVRVLNPGETALYYAKQARNEVYAQSIEIQSGRNVLAPVFFLYETTKNLALSIIVIILTAGAFSILISNLTFSESKLNIVQLFLNTGITTVFILLYYEIAAIIYDLTVNYGNALVAGVLTPYINARAVLERLQPGGDLSIMALFSTMYFVGVNDALIVVLKSISSYFEPVLYQTAQATQSILPGATGYALGGSGVANLISATVSSMTGFVVGLFIPGIKYILSAKPLFDTILAFIIFFMQLRIFFTLLSSFVGFILMTGFGPIMIVSSGINEGWENGILPKIKMLMANGLVFPVTFFFILLAAITFNIRMPESIIADMGENVRKEQICSFDTAISNINGGAVNEQADRLYSDAYYSHKVANTLNQNIFDTVPSYPGSCNTSFVSLPWMYFPAPLGIIGPPSEQPLVVTGLVMTFLGVGFIVLASLRSSQFVSELLDVKPEFQSLSGIVGDTLRVVKAVPTVATITVPVTAGLTSLGIRAFIAGGTFVGKRGMGGLFRLLDNTIGRRFTSTSGGSTTPPSGTGQNIRPRAGWRGPGDRPRVAPPRRGQGRQAQNLQQTPNNQANNNNNQAAANNQALTRAERIYMGLRQLLTGIRNIGRETLADYYDDWVRPRSTDLTGAEDSATGRQLTYEEYVNSLSNRVATRVGRQAGVIGPNQTTTIAGLPPHLQSTAYQQFAESLQRGTQGIQNLSNAATQAANGLNTLLNLINQLVGRTGEFLKIIDTLVG